MTCRDPAWDAPLAALSMDSTAAVYQLIYNCKVFVGGLVE